MNNYSLVFKMEETMSKDNYGKKGKDSKIPSRLRSFYSHTNSVLLASLYTPKGQKAVELYLDTSGKRGRNFSENQYFLRFSERSIEWVPETIVFYSPEHIHAYLVQELKKKESFEVFTNDSAVSYVDVFYPHLKSNHQVEIQEIAEKLVRKYFPIYDYEHSIKSNFFKGRLGFLIVVESEDMTKEDYLNIMMTMSDLKEELNLRANEITLSYRQKLGLKDTSVSWKITEPFYHHIANSNRDNDTYLECFTGGEEFLSLTSKGLTLSLFAKGNRDGSMNQYIVKLTENHKKPITIGVIDDSHELENHLVRLKEMFHELFFDNLDSFHFLVKVNPSESEWIEVWTREKFNYMLDAVSDSFDFKLYGNKYSTKFREKDKHCLILLSNSAKLNDANLRDDVKKIMEDAIHS